MSTESESIGTYNEFTEKILSKIKKLDTIPFSLWLLWNIHIMHPLDTKFQTFMQSHLGLVLLKT